MPLPADPKAFLTSLFEAAVAAAQADQVIAANLPERPKGRTIVVGAGKGSAQMAKAFEQAWAAKYENARLEGVVVTRYGFGAQCRQIDIIEASHPVPDAAGLVASKRLLNAVSGLTEDDLVVALISGGGSALLPSPPEGMSLADEIAVNKVLLASGAPISAMNTVRKHLSTIKGGRLAAAAYPARVVSLIVSDIPGDNPAFVASGPTVPDDTSVEDARKIVEQYRLQLPDAAMKHLNSKVHNERLQISPGNSIKIIASAAVSLQAAAEEARRQGVDAVILSDAIEGEAREIAHMHAAIAREVLEKDRPFKAPLVILSGGETTVTVRGSGKGGRNTEFLLSFAMDIAGLNGLSALAADTDGIDGSQDNAGAFADGSTIARLIAAGHDARDLLNANNAWTAFDAIGDLFVPGPTGTNVNDFRAIYIFPA
jgi:glycerate 2-kinase